MDLAELITRERQEPAMVRKEDSLLVQRSLWKKHQKLKATEPTDITAKANANNVSSQNRTKITAKANRKHERPQNKLLQAAAE